MYQKNEIQSGDKIISDSEKYHNLENDTTFITQQLHLLSLYCTHTQSIIT